MPLATVLEKKTLSEELKRNNYILAGDIGDRNLHHYEKLNQARDFLVKSFASHGFKPLLQTFRVKERECSNIEVIVEGAGKKDEIVVIGAHYDSVNGCPGANDNGTGAVATLALACAFRDKKPERTIRFVEFVNEEPPYFQTDDMGSVHYAKRCRQRNEKIVAMLSLETMGCYSDEKGSQKYPPIIQFFYPSVGNFIGFVANFSSKKLVDGCVRSFKSHSRFPIDSIAIFEAIPGVGWSDHWSFWQQGYPGLMVTDTAPYRYPYYHTSQDTPDKVDYSKLAEVVCGLEGVINDLSSKEL